MVKPIPPPEANDSATSEAAGGLFKGPLRSSAWPVTGLIVLLLVSLLLMSDATENSAHFGQLYSILLLVNALGLVSLGGLILWNLVRLIRQVGEGRPGARLTARMVTTFVILSVTPVVVVYFFSLQFLHRGIDSWFDVRIEQALKDALDLGRTSLDGQMRDRLKQTELLARALAAASSDSVAARLSDAFELSRATELTLLSSQGRVVAANADTSSFVPNRPDDAILLQLRQSGSYIGLDPIGDAGLYIRAVVQVNEGPTGEKLYLQGLFPIAERMSTLADSVQKAFAKYRELVYLRRPLKVTFTLTLSLVLLFSLLTAVWAAFFFARRMVAPLRDMANATQAVATGDYERQLPAGGPDELGFLVTSFNDMTRKLALARDETRQSQRQVETQHTYLQAMLSRLSSGVLTTDADQQLHTTNKMAGQILGVDIESELGLTLDKLTTQHPHLLPLVQCMHAHLQDSTEDWREEVIIFGPNGRQILMCRGTPLPGPAALSEAGRAASTVEQPSSTPHGQLLVFDDLTTLIEAQRNQAWSEVARRLAHEIKNPLTPIQLSAERLRHKYLPKMQGADAETMDRLTRTIVSQVESMKEMVNAFSSYARTPETRVQMLDLNALVRDVVELYGDGSVRIETRLDSGLPLLEADPDRMRQVLHNLVKNAVEAADGEARKPCLSIETRTVKRSVRHYIEVAVCDEGTGIRQDLIERVFEPYVSSKAKGTGLGLAIVKKIVEEHSGMVWAENRSEGGARIVMQFPTLDLGPAGQGSSPKPGQPEDSGATRAPVERA